jgi:hypothetical protein
MADRIGEKGGDHFCAARSGFTAHATNEGGDYAHSAACRWHVPDGADTREPLHRRFAAADSGGAERPAFAITHTIALEDGRGMDKTFGDKEDNCIKVVMKR